jgi:hypothetical protein
MKTLRISDALSLPLDWITLATVVYGARGAGKTSFGRVVAEEAVKAKQRFCAIDLKGDWYGLRSSADGKSDGIPVVIFGGEHADVPLEPDAGAFVGETVARLEQSCILDFELLSKGKQIRFLAEFFEALYHHNREPLLLLLDEAQRYAPQKPGPDEARTLGAVQDLVKLGRKHGIGPVLFTQRGAGLNKEVSELCDLLVAFRTPGPLDQERIRDWLDANTTKAQRDEVMGKLSGLPTGTAVFASGHPELRTFGVYPVRRPETFDSSATPKVGQRRAEPKTLAKPDLEVLRTKMAAAIERAKADDPKALRARIRELEVELAKKPKAEAPEVKEVRLDVAVFDREAWTRVKESIVNEWVGARDRIVGALDAYRVQVIGSDQYPPLKRHVPRLVEAMPPPMKVTHSQSGPIVHRDGQAQRFDRKRREQSNGAVSELPKGERAILTAIAQHPNGVSREQLTVLTGYKRSSRDTYLQRLGAGGLLEPGTGGAIFVSDRGMAALGDFEPLPTGRALLEHWLAKLPEGERRILDVVARAYPNGVHRASIDHETGYKRSSRDTYLQRLSSRKLIVTEAHGTVALSEDLA